MSKRDTPTQDCSAPAQMARFLMADGAVLEIHVPDAVRVETEPSEAHTPGFVLRRGRRIVNVGALRSMFHE